MPCANNSSQNCGGQWGLNVYQPAPVMLGNPPQISGYNAMGCYAEKPKARALKSLFASDVMTVQLCAKQASANGAAFFGLEYGQECWYDTVLDGAVAGAQSNCMMNCTGSSFQTCGGSNYLQLYGNATVLSSSSVVVSPVPTTLSTTSSPSTSIWTSPPPTAAPPQSTAPPQPAAPNASPLSCPASNGTTYASPNGGQYLIECGIDRTGKLLSVYHSLLTSFADDISF
jgi:pyruvate/2-oxoglutarate dehydrogenase complex dihydrolipoamide acyltransferase (E2) component